MIRPYRDTDLSDVVGVWHRAGRAAYTFLPTWQALALEKAHDVFRQVIAARSKIWVATDHECIAGFLAMQNAYIDRLYVDPSMQRKGLGRLLLQHAKRLHPDRLTLHTHQANHPARAFYEYHGFVAIKFGISPPPESAPDVEYEWRPTAAKS